MGRRALLQVGTLGLLGTGLADLLRLETQASTKSRIKAKSVVFIFQSGGPSQHETFDPDSEFRDAQGRPYKFTQGSPIAGLV